MAGADREFIALLCWLNAAGCQKLIGEMRRRHWRRACAPSQLVREHVREGARAVERAHPGSSEHIARVILLPDAPSIDANEITDKGYINQRLALERRRADVARLYAAQPDPAVICGQVSRPFG